MYGHLLFVSQVTSLEDGEPFDLCVMSRENSKFEVVQISEEYGQTPVKTFDILHDAKKFISKV